MTGSVAIWCAVLASGLAVVAIGLASTTTALMPGPLTTSHRFSSGCETCHSTIGQGQFGWLHALVQFADPKKDSGACLTCHTIGDSANVAKNRTVFFPHGLPKKRLEATAKIQNQRRQKSVPAKTGSSSAVDQLRGWLNASPGEGPETVFCATCHKEHQGTHADLTAMSDQRCQTCHQVQFDTFEADHPKFADYPFRRRTRLIFDHARHFGTHFKETREKRPDAKFIPDTCVSCHASTKDKRHMVVKPFAETCSTCHLPQIVGAERATGPKGLALLTLPALDLETLREKKAPIGQWPEETDAELTPLMQLLLAGTAERREVLLAASRLDLQDLSKASDPEIEAVVQLVWEIKRLLFALTTSKASDILKRIGHGANGKVDKRQIAKLLATLPRDVLVAAQREWLPQLAGEIALRKKPDWKKAIRASTKSIAKAEEAAEDDEEEIAEEKPTSTKLETDPSKGRWYVNVLGEIVQEGAESEEAKQAAKGEVEGPAPSAAAAETRDDDPEEEEKVEISLDETAIPAVDAESWT
ncbi:MAG: cytochrome c3 family protein, partial [Hyphomicrobiaceae bacterium]